MLQSEKLASLDKELEDKRMDFEKKCFDKEQRYVEQDLKIASLESKVSAFPDEIKNALKLKEAELTDKLVTKYSHLMEIQKKEQETEVKVLKQRMINTEVLINEKEVLIKQLNKKIDKLNEDNRSLIIKSSGVIESEKAVIKSPKVTSKPKILRATKRTL